MDCRCQKSELFTISTMALTRVTTAIFKQYESSVIEELVQEALTDTVKVSKPAEVLVENIHLISSGNNNDNETMTSNFIKTCPLIKTQSRDDRKTRRVGVSERNALDRYIFKVVFNEFVISEMVNEHLLGDDR